MVDERFLPDTISSDIHQFCIYGPARDLLHVASKILALGVSLEEIIDMMTCNAALALQRSELGSLNVGEAADLSILEVIDEPTTFEDASGQAFSGQSAIFAKQVFVSGREI